MYPNLIKNEKCLTELSPPVFVIESVVLPNLNPNPRPLKHEHKHWTLGIQVHESYSQAGIYIDISKVHIY